jgi:hypothetical protein
MKIADIITESYLEELTGIKNVVKDMPRNPRRMAEYPLGMDWHKLLYNNGFRALGSGSFGTVWDNPNLPYVLKVFTDQDRAYIDWINTARQHSDNPHMPHFISTKAMRIVPGVVAVRMEKLTRITREAYELVKPINALLTNSMRTGLSPSEIVDKLIAKREPDAPEPADNSFYAYTQKYPSFVPALDILNQFVKQSGYRLDVHDENIMMRGPVMVFTDPVYDRTALASR